MYQILLIIILWSNCALFSMATSLLLWGPLTERIFKSATHYCQRWRQDTKQNQRILKYHKNLKDSGRRSNCRDRSFLLQLNRWYWSKKDLARYAQTHRIIYLRLRVQLVASFSTTICLVKKINAHSKCQPVVESQPVSSGICRELGFGFVSQ